MSLETDTEATIRAALVAALGGVVVRWLPSDLPFTPPSAAPWVQATVLWASGLLHTMGGTGAKNLLLGALVCNVFAQLRLDPALARAVAGDIRTALNRAQLTGVVRFDVPRPAQPVRFENQYWQVHTELSFSVEEVL